MLHIRATISGTPFIALLCCSLLGAADPGYPCWMGATGSGTAQDSGKPAITTAKDIRRLWVNDQKIQQGWHSPGDGVKRKGISMGYGSPIVSGKLVVVAWYEPSGTAIDEERLAKDKYPDKAKWGIDADDIVMAVDAETGKTAWIKRFAGKGYNHNANGSSPWMSACAADGLVCVIGSAGVVYCLDLGSGDLRWESSLQDNHRAMLEVKEQSLAAKTLEQYPPDFLVAPVIIDGVLLCSDASGKKSKKKGASGLRAWDLQSGKELYHLPGGMNPRRRPLPWRHGDKTLAVVQGNQISCIEPRSGTVLWTAPSCDAFGISGDILVGRGIRKQSSLTALRLSSTGAEQLWSHPYKKGKGEGICTGTPCIYRGHVYATTNHHATAKGVMCWNLETGEQVGHIPGPHAHYVSPIASDGLLLFSDDKVVSLCSTDPKDFRHLGNAALPIANSITPAIAYGRLFMRTRTGLACYALTR